MLNRLDILYIFCAAAEARNFKEAAARIGVSPQAVTRAVKELENQLGELLFHRSTRGSRVTEFGEQLAIQARSRLQGIDEIFRKQDRAADKVLSGLVRIAAPQSLGQQYLLPMLRQLQVRHPGLQLELRLSDEPADVIDERIDVGVRHGFMRDSRFVARRICQVPFYIVGSPALLETHGEPRSLRELAKCPTTVSLDARTGKPWPWFLAEGQHWVPPRPTFATNDIRAECDAIVAGMGFGQLAGFLAIPHLRAARLVQILPDISPPPWEIYVYRPQKGPVAARVRMVFDWLVSGLTDLAFPGEDNS